MKQNETFDQEREDLYHTFDEEDEESQTESSVPSTPLSRNRSEDVPVPWPRSYHFLFKCSVFVRDLKKLFFRE